MPMFRMLPSPWIRAARTVAWGTAVEAASGPGGGWPAAGALVGATVAGGGWLSLVRGGEGGGLVVQAVKSSQQPSKMTPRLTVLTTVPPGITYSLHRRVAFVDWPRLASLYGV